MTNVSPQQYAPNYAYEMPPSQGPHSKKTAPKQVLLTNPSQIQHPLVSR